MDLPRYLARIGFGGKPAPDLATLARLQALHVATIPFENLAALAGEPIGLGGEWRELYRFDLTEQLRADYEVSNWYLLTNPASQFLSNLIVARAEPGARHALRNARYSVHRPDGTTMRNFLHDVDALKRVLLDVMHLHVPDSPSLDTRLAECMRREVLVP